MPKKVAEGDKRVRINITIDPHLNKKLLVYESRSDFINTAVKEKLERIEASKRAMEEMCQNSQKPVSKSA
jgi:Arc/MetJ-type ribon-helix-helix transcriptional regulator